MKPNRNNYASYNNYWYAMRTYRARLGGVVPPEPEVPAEIVETFDDFNVWSASAQRGDLPEYLNEDWVWYGVTSDSAINQVIVEMTVPVAPEGYRIKHAMLRTAAAPTETYRTDVWTEMWATFVEVEEPLDAYQVLDGTYLPLAGYMPYKGEEPLEFMLWSLPAEGTTGYVVLMEYTSVITSNAPATPGPTIRFDKNFSIEYVYELIPDDEEVPE